MKYLEPYEVFIIKKILLETTEKPIEYNIRDFYYEKENWKRLLDFLLELDKQDTIFLGN